MHIHTQIYRNRGIKRCVQPLLMPSIMRDAAHSSIAVVTWLGFLSTNMAPLSSITVVTWLGFLSTNMAPLSLVLVELVVAAYARAWTSDTP